MLPDDVKARLTAVRQALKPRPELGFHAHHNLAMGIANSLTAIECGANRIDAAAAGLGAGAGNTPMEVLVAVLRAHGHRHRRGPVEDPGRGRDLVVPMMDFPIRIDRDALTLATPVYGVPALRQSAREGLRRAGPRDPCSNSAAASWWAARRIMIGMPPSPRWRGGGLQG